MKHEILNNRHYLLVEGTPDNNYAYYSAKLLNKCGVIVDKPKLLTREMLARLFAFYCVYSVPKSFYKNPQDLRYFTCDELVLEQLVSYFNIEFIAGVDSNNKEDFERIELFKKALPDYKEGDEVNIRMFKIVTEAEADEIFRDIVKSYCSYTRRWNGDEEREFKFLYDYYDDFQICSKDNLIRCLDIYKQPVFAKQLDQKDVVKLSVRKIGDKKNFTIASDSDDYAILHLGVKYCKKAPLTKKQAKYFNTIAKKVGIDLQREDNARSPYKLAVKYMNEGKPVEAAKVFSQSGSLLERNLLWILSRCNNAEFDQVIELIKADNPIVLIQLLLGLTKDDYTNKRIFQFRSSTGLSKFHEETDEEFTYRKSKLSLGQKQHMLELIDKKLCDSYKNKPSLGKVYISDEFKNVAAPLSTTSSGKGLDILPVGSRLPIKGEYLRTFCYWKGPRDVDTSCCFIKSLKDIDKPGNVNALYWGNYALKEFGNSCLCSGDDRSDNGVEYCDFRIQELLDKGYKYAVYSLNGYGSDFTVGNIYCGYQDKDDLDTEAWSAKNMALRLHVNAPSRCYMGFALDLEKREVIILNTISESDARVVRKEQIVQFRDILDASLLSVMNMYKIISYRGEVVDNPEDADYIFSSDMSIQYDPEKQKFIRPYDVEQLVQLI